MPDGRSLGSGFEVVGDDFSPTALEVRKRVTGMSKEKKVEACFPSLFFSEE